ncbi:MAG TPA: hypothetical protein QGF58_04965 [Myxococcota bacterium]|nr:hypothetical protein [Myxococcota bacterium]
MFLLSALTMLGCGPDATVIDGTVDGYAVSDPLTALWGGPFVIFVDVELTCYDMSFVRRTYDAAEAPADFDFVALQFGFDEDATQKGNFNVAGDAAVAAKALAVKGGAFVENRGRDGNLQVQSMEDNGLMEGSFDITFGDDVGSYSTEYFSADYCNNLVRN